MCSTLDKDPSREAFARSLIAIVEYCITVEKDLLGLLMDTLVIIGDLTASESFTESSIFV